MDNSSYLQGNITDFSLPNGFLSKIGGGNLNPNPVSGGLQQTSPQNISNRRPLFGNNQGKAPVAPVNPIYNNPRNPQNQQFTPNYPSPNFNPNQSQNPIHQDPRRPFSENHNPGQQRSFQERGVSREWRNQHQQGFNPAVPAQQTTSWEANLQAEETEFKTREKYYTGVITTSVIGLLLYFVGAFLIIFVENVGGETIVNLPSYRFTWELLLTDFPTFARNLFSSVFGYFFQYARLFGFFPEVGNLTVDPVPKYLMPVDILIKLSTILYFHYKWMPWDIKKSFEKGLFNKNYPYLESNTTPKKSNREIQEAELLSINIPDEELNKLPHNTSASVYNSPTHTADRYPDPAEYGGDSEEDDADQSLLPFSGVQKPLEEWYQEHEVRIYSFIRRNILPGSNLLLALYFSTLRVLDFRQPQFVIWYVLVIMSMFWCMQTFLLSLDHSQYPPDEE